MDASITVAWLIEGESSPLALRIREHVARDGALVPTLWRLEVANALLIACRKSRLARVDAASALAALAVMPIAEDHETGSMAWADAFRLADAHKLTVYDASYLELALRTGLPLATLDRELARAAAVLGVPAP